MSLCWGVGRESRRIPKCHYFTCPYKGEDGGAKVNKDNVFIRALYFSNGFPYVVYIQTEDWFSAM